VRFPLDEAKGHVEASRLDEVRSCVQPQGIEPQGAGCAFQFPHEKASHALTPRRRFHEDSGHLADVAGAHPHSCTTENRRPLTGEEKDTQWRDEVITGVSGLRIQDLDLPRARLQVKQTVVADKGYQRIEAPKDYEHRSIPIPEFLVTMLEQQVDGRLGPQPVFFGMRTKTYLRNHAFRKGWFDPAASLAVSAGAHVKSVQRMLGHASAAMTVDTYADLFDDDLDNVASALNEIALKSAITGMISPPGEAPQP
jgi:hypothetical protein